jgi:hypothetical protein
MEPAPGGGTMGTIKQPTPRSRLLGFYIKAKAATWFMIGIATIWGFFVAKEVEVRDVAYFILLFAVPAILLWILGVAVTARVSASWWFAVGYLATVLLAKAILGSTDLPSEVWYWAKSRNLPSFYLNGLMAFAVFSTAVLAADVAALASFISLPCRAAYGVGKVDRKTLDDIGEGTFW